MLVVELKKHHIKEVAELEREVYSEYMCLGEEDFTEDFDNASSNYSLGVFVKGKLVAYIIAYVKKKAEQQEDIFFSKNNRFFSRGHIYVSDLVCTNPKALLPLLIQFKNSTSGCTIEAEFRENSYLLIKKLSEKYPDMIEIKSEEKWDNYYETEDAYHMIFESTDLFPIVYNDIKSDIISCIYHSTRGMTEIKRVLTYLKDSYSLDEIKQQKNFILRSLHKRNLEFLNTIGEDFNLLIQHEAGLSPHSTEAFLNGLSKKGYTLIDSETRNISLYGGNNVSTYDKKYDAYQGRNIIHWYYTQTLDNTKYNNSTIAYYRWKIKRDAMNFFKNSKFIQSVYVLNKHKEVILSFHPKYDSPYKIIPCNYSNMFDSDLKEMAFEYKIQDMKRASIQEEVERIGYNYTGTLVRMRKVTGEETAIQFFDKLCLIAKENGDWNMVFHDWLYVVDELFNHKYLLTKGAYQSLFLSSLNRMKQINDLLRNLNTKNMPLEQVKEYRKAISVPIRKGENIEEIVKEISNQIEDSFLKKINLKEEDFQLAKEFVKRMNRYSEHVNIHNLYHVFKNRTGKIIRGQSKGIFKEQDFTPNYIQLTELLHQSLGSKGQVPLVSKPKRLYSSLRKIGPIEEVLVGNMTSKEGQQVVKELRQRRVNVSELIEKLPLLSAKVEKKCSPEYLVAGDASVCCMSFGNKNAIAYAKEKGFGILNIYYKDRIVANSVIWINEKYNSLVIDNIEVHPNYVQLNPIIKDLYFKVIENLLEEYNLDFSVQGSSYNDLKLYNDGLTATIWDLEPKDVNLRNFYTDANLVFPIPVKKGVGEILDIISKGQKKEVHSHIEEFQYT